MKHLLNTLFVTTQGSYLAREGQTVLIRVKKETKARFPIHTLSQIICFGRVAVSPPLMGLCGEKKVSIAFLNEWGRFFARVQGPVSGNVLLRREQYRRADDESASSEMARAVITSKLANCRIVLLRAIRDRPGDENNPAIERAGGVLGRLLDDLRRPMSLESVRGLEGEAARTYFGVFNYLITSQNDGFVFQNRSRRPPLDKVNALLSFLYTLLANEMTSASESVGLDPAVGFLHRDRPGRMGLALDIMEEFRPILADRLALSLINRQQIKAKGFTTTESGAVVMDDATRKEVLVAWQKRKQEEIVHPFLNEKVQIGLLPYIQAMLLARHIRGDLDGYPPFFWK